MSSTTRMLPRVGAAGVSAKALPAGEHTLPTAPLSKMAGGTCHAAVGDAVSAYMKRTIIIVVILFVFSGSAAFAAEAPCPWSFQSEFDLYLSLKAGAEYRFSDHFGIRGTLGACVISPTQFSWTLAGVDHFLGPASRFQLDLHLGLIEDIIDVLGPLPSTYLVPGACLSFGYLSPSGHGIAIRVGAGVTIGYDLGAWQKPGFLPDLALEYSWRPR